MRRFTTGSLTKNGKNKDGVATYNLNIILNSASKDMESDELVLKDVVSLFNNPEHGALTRVVSMSLRHGVPIQYVVEQLKKDKHSDLFSFSTIMARVLKNYIKDGTKVTIEKTCVDCGGTNLQYQQGCVVCLDCGNSKCG